MTLTMLSCKLCVTGASETIATTSCALEHQHVTRCAVGQGNRTPAS